MLAWIVQLGYKAGAAATPPPPVQTGQTPAGRISRRRSRYIIRIEGRLFRADSDEEAIAILRQAEKLAEVAATRKADEIVERALPKAVSLGAVKPIRIKVPTIDASPELEQQAAMTAVAVARAYENASMLAEMRLLLALAEEDEEEVLLLS